MFTVKELAEFSRGELLNIDNQRLSISGISIDSRKIKEKEAFLALKGNNFDGHSFVKEAFSKGARVAIVSNLKGIKDLPLVKVEDTQKALGDIASAYRDKFNLTVIGISGSNGKTTTKEMLYSILKHRFKTLKAPASYNNFVGVPLSLLRIKPETEVLIQEMETNRWGGIKILCSQAKPLIGIVTNISFTHLETLNTVRGVFKEKAELIESLPSKGLAILNADEEYFYHLIKKAEKRKVVSFGIENKADFKAEDVEYRGNSLRFKVRGKEFILKTTFYKNIYNALASIATAYILGVEIKEAINYLFHFRFLPLRWQIEKKKGIIFIKDCFNANPASLEDALLSFREFVHPGRKIAILGDMLELGKKSFKLHYEVGAFASNLGYLDAIFSIGKEAYHIYKGAEKKTAKGIIKHFKTKRDCLKFLREYLKVKDIVLLKASRAMALEDIVKEF